MKKDSTSDKSKKNDDNISRLRDRLRSNIARRKTTKCLSKNDDSK
jgi:hypothetical protein